MRSPLEMAGNPPKTAGRARFPCVPRSKWRGIRRKPRAELDSLAVPAGYGGESAQNLRQSSISLRSPLQMAGNPPETAAELDLILFPAKMAGNPAKTAGKLDFPTFPAQNGGESAENRGQNSIPLRSPLKLAGNPPKTAAELDSLRSPLEMAGNPPKTAAELDSSALPAKIGGESAQNHGRARFLCVPRSKGRGIRPKLRQSSISPRSPLEMAGNPPAASGQQGGILRHWLRRSPPGGLAGHTQSRGSGSCGRVIRNGRRLRAESYTEFT